MFISAVAISLYKPRHHSEAWEAPREELERYEATNRCPIVILGKGKGKLHIKPYQNTFLMAIKVTGIWPHH